MIAGRQPYVPGRRLWPLGLALLGVLGTGCEMTGPSKNTKGRPVVAEHLPMPTELAPERGPELVVGNVPSPRAMPLELVTDRITHDLTIKSLAAGAYEIRTTGSDPYIHTRPISGDYDPQALRVLSFEYFCDQGLDHFEVFFGPPIRAGYSVKGDPPGVSEGWIPYAVDIAEGTDKWTRPYTQFRLDFGGQAGKLVRIRNIRLRTPTRAELQRALNREQRRAGQRAFDLALRAYLATDMPATVDSVAVDQSDVVISGTTPAAMPNLHLVEVRPWQDACRLRHVLFSRTVAGPGFALRLPRLVDAATGPYDRVLSRWMVMQSTGDSAVRRSTAVYPTDLSAAAQWHYPEDMPTSKKGLNGVGTGHRQWWGDLVELGVHNVAVNIVLSAFIRETPADGWAPYEHLGTTYYINSGWIDAQSDLLRFCDAHDIIVAAIILVPRHHPTLSHPDAMDPGIYAMPDMTREAGVRMYAAGMAYLAERYSRADKKFGRIKHWILHNEVDAGWVWTNAGHKTINEYVDLYVKSMRLAYGMIRSASPNARVYVSLTHHWAHTGPNWYPSKDIIDLLGVYSQVEGDFDWGVAYHPYPQNLRDPRVWLDNQVRFDFTTPKITFKNIEVLPAYMKQQRLLYRGKTPRRIILSEQGLNSPDWSEQSQRLQAAGFVYMWHKLRDLDGIEAFHNHRWIDNATEGGLLLGLWTFKKGTDETPDKRKKAWYVFKALGTPEEAEATEFAKKIIGVKSFDEIPYRGRIGQ